MHLSCSGKTPTRKHKDQEKIYLIYQYFIPKDEARKKELQTCLKFNADNPHIDTIYLLNEKIYSKGELGIENDKIKQINITTRLKFKDVFKFVNTEQLKGYIVMCNSDIFFDNTINSLRKSTLSQNKQVLCQLRFEYTDKKLGKCKLFGPRADSQDAWMFHSNNNPIKALSAFNFVFGHPGCDNKLIYLFHVLGFEVFNDPFFIKTYHNHQTDQRNYGLDLLHKPYMLISPFIHGQNIHNQTDIWGTVGYRLLKTHSLTINNITRDFTRFIFKTDNEYLKKCIVQKIKSGQNFMIMHTHKDIAIVCSICLILNNITEGTFFKTGEILHGVSDNRNMNVFLKLVDEFKLKYNIDSNRELINLVVIHCEILNKSDIVLGFSTWDNKYRELMIENKNTFYNLLFNNFQHKQWISSEVLNIYNLIYQEPWIRELKGKRILLITYNSKEISEQINRVNLKDIYGLDLFIDCEFSFINYEGVYDANIQNNILSNINDFDVALCNCDINGIFIAEFIYNNKKSVIDIGESLPMYFGLWSLDDYQINKDVINIFINKNWKRL